LQIRAIVSTTYPRHLGIVPMTHPRYREFSTPNYKVLAGNFKTRIEAERNLIEIRKKYKNVLLIKPNRK
jgi:hypothetical protein